MTAGASAGTAPAAAQNGRGGAAPILRTENLTERFGGLTALNNVTIEVPRGEIRAVIGPNGAGKSTFFNCLTGVLRPTSGRVVSSSGARKPATVRTESAIGRRA